MKEKRVWEVRALYNRYHVICNIALAVYQLDTTLENLLYSR